MQANRLSQSPFHAIALDRPAQHPAHGEPDAEPFALLAQQIKYRHVSGEVAAALFIYPLEVAVPEQAHAACKSGPLAGARQVETTVRSETAHSTHDPNSGCGIAVNSGKGNRLLTEAGFYRHPLASLGAPARDHRLAALGFHPGTKSVRLRAVTSVRLECALGHETSLLLIQLVGAIIAVGRMRSINGPRQTGKPASVEQRGCSRSSAARVAGDAMAERFPFADGCTMPAAVTKSLLDRLFFSRFELQN